VSEPYGEREPAAEILSDASSRRTSIYSFGMRNGRHVGTRTPDLYRVKNEVTDVNPFACLAFRIFIAPKMGRLGRVLVTNGDEFPWSGSELPAIADT